MSASVSGVRARTEVRARTPEISGRGREQRSRPLPLIAFRAACGRPEQILP